MYITAVGHLLIFLKVCVLAKEIYLSSERVKKIISKFCLMYLMIYLLFRKLEIRGFFLLGTIKANIGFIGCLFNILTL